MKIDQIWIEACTGRWRGQDDDTIMTIRKRVALSACAGSLRLGSSVMRVPLMPCQYDDHIIQILIALINIVTAQIYIDA